MLTFHPITFRGTFSKLDTYSLAMNAAERPGGIASEDLEHLKMRIKDRYRDHVTIHGDVYQNPATLSIDGDPNCVYSADCFVKRELDCLDVKYEYDPYVLFHTR